MSDTMSPSVEIELHGKEGLVEDWSQDKQVYDMPWGKAMMWLFLLSDTFIFSVFLFTTQYKRILA